MRGGARYVSFHLEHTPRHLEHAHADGPGLERILTPSLRRELDELRSKLAAEPSSLSLDDRLKLNELINPQRRGSKEVEVRQRIEDERKKGGEDAPGGGVPLPPGPPPGTRVYK